MSRFCSRNPPSQVLFQFPLILISLSLFLLWSSNWIQLHGLKWEQLVSCRVYRRSIDVVNDSIGWLLSTLLMSWRRREFTNVTRCLAHFQVATKLFWWKSEWCLQPVMILRMNDDVYSLQKQLTVRNFVTVSAQWSMFASAFSIAFYLVAYNSVFSSQKLDQTSAPGRGIFSAEYWLFVFSTVSVPRRQKFRKNAFCW